MGCVAWRLMSAQLSWHPFIFVKSQNLIQWLDTHKRNVRISDLQIRSNDFIWYPFISYSTRSHGDMPYFLRCLAHRVECPKEGKGCHIYGFPYVVMIQFWQGLIKYLSASLIQKTSWRQIAPHKFTTKIIWKWTSGSIHKRYIRTGNIKRNSSSSSSLFSQRIQAKLHISITHWIHTNINGKGSRNSNAYLAAYLGRTKKYTHTHTHKRTHDIWKTWIYGKHFYTKIIEDT